MALSINLSTDVYGGGTFELRDRQTKAPLAQINNTGFGDALLFRVSNNLEHRVTEVVGKVAKTACAGWFRATGVSLFADLVEAGCKHTNNAIRTALVWRESQELSGQRLTLQF